MPMSSFAVWRRRRLPSLFAALAMVAVVAACDDSSGDDGDVANLSVNPTTPTLNIGQVQQMVATATTSGGRIIDAEVDWTTSAPGVATVDGNGLVTGVGGGTATITATVGGVSEDAAVTVWFPVQSVALAIAAGQSQTIRQEGATVVVPTILDSQGAPAPTRQLVWTSSDTDVATVNSTGAVAAKGIDGTATITATTLDGVAGTIDITVSGSPVVATVTVTPSTTLVGMGQTLQLTRTARAASGTIIPGVATTWESSDDGIASVDAAGLVTGVALGSATVTATAETVDGTSAITVLTNMPEGANVIPTTSDAGAAGGIRDYALHVPEGLTSFTVATTAATGDIDLYVFAPGATPGPFSGSTFAGFICRPWLVGSTEECVIDAPAAGVYRIRIHAFPEGGEVTGGTATVTFTP